MNHYVVGFLFNDDPDGPYTYVVLIQKERPPWQKGLLNGVGGHIEDGETPAQAMRREFREEAGVDIPDWVECVVLRGQSWVVHFFTASTPPGSIAMPTARTDEPLRIVRTDKLPDNTVKNLHWIIPLCRDAGIEKPVTVNDLLPAEADHR